MECAVGPVEDFDVNRRRASRGAPVPSFNELRFAGFVLLSDAEETGFRTKESGPGFIDGISIHSQPMAHLAEALSLRPRNNSVGVGTDVEQVVAALAGDVN